jgi:hypothetical protein
LEGDGLETTVGLGLTGAGVEVATADAAGVTTGVGVSAAVGAASPKSTTTLSEAP